MCQAADVRLTETGDHAGGQDSHQPGVRLPAARHDDAALPGVEATAAVYSVSGATVRRTAYVDPDETSGITTYADPTGDGTTVTLHIPGADPITITADDLR